MSYTVHIKLPAGWKNHREAVDKGLQNGLMKATILLTNRAIDRAPRKTGTLKRSIRMDVSSIGKFTGKIIQDKGVAKYGGFIEYGTGIYHEPDARTPWTIEPKNKKVLAWRSGPVMLENKSNKLLYQNKNGDFTHKKGEAAMIFARKVTIKGMKSRSYIRSTIKDSLTEIEALINEQIALALREAGG